jgi:hypothetical protein
MRLMELSDLEIYVHDDTLETAGMEKSDLIQYDNLKIVSLETISKLILEAEMSLKY